MDIVFFVHVFHCACNENHNGKKPLTHLYNDRSQDGKTIVSFEVVSTESQTLYYMALLVSRTELYHTGGRTTNGNISISINPSFLLISVHKATTHTICYILCVFPLSGCFQ